MDWFFKLIRIAGVNFPVAASFVQLQAEIDSVKTAKLIETFRDPISYLHEDIRAVSIKIYEQLKIDDSAILYFPEEFYITYSRAIAALDSQGYLTKENAAGCKFPLSLQLTDSSYIMYMCNLAEQSSKMDEITSIVDKCQIGSWLDGKKLAQEIGLPTTVVRSIFSIYESKGYGYQSTEIGAYMYIGQA